MKLNRILLTSLGIVAVMAGTLFGDDSEVFKDILKKGCSAIALKEALKHDLIGSVQGISSDELLTGKYSFIRELKTIELVRRTPLAEENGTANPNEEVFELEYYVQLETNPAQGLLVQYQVLVAEKTRPWHGNLKRRSCGLIDITWVEPKPNK